MSLEISVRLSSKKVTSSHPYEDLKRRFDEISWIGAEPSELISDIDDSIVASTSGDDIQRLHWLRNQITEHLEKDEESKIRWKQRKTHLSQHEQSNSSEDIFKSNDFVFFISDSLANDGSLISSGLQGQIIKKYPTQRGNLVYLVRVGDKEVSTFAENIRMAMRLSTAGEDPHSFDSATDTESGAQTDIGGDAVRTHAPPIPHLKDDEHVTWKYNPQHQEWDKVLEKVAKLINGQINPTPASVSPFSSKLQDLSINYQSNPQGTFNAQQVADTLNEAVLTQDEQEASVEEQNQQAEQRDKPEQQKQASSGNITAPTDHDRSQLEEDDEGRLNTNIDIDGPNQTHQIMTKNKDDDDVFDWLPSPFDIGEDGNYKTQPGGPNVWL